MHDAPLKVFNVVLCPSRDDAETAEKLTTLFHGNSVPVWCGALPPAGPAQARSEQLAVPDLPADHSICFDDAERPEATAAHVLSAAHTAASLPQRDIKPPSDISSHPSFSLIDGPWEIPSSIVFQEDASTPAVLRDLVSGVDEMPQGLSLQVTLDVETGALLLLRSADVLNAEEAISSATTHDASAAHEVVRLVGGLPLALDLAGACIRHSSGGVSYYLSRLQAALQYFDADRCRTEPRHLSIRAAFAVSLSELSNRFPAASQLLHIAACLAPGPIPIEVFTAGALEFPSPLRLAATDPPLWKAALDAVVSFAFMELDSTGHFVSIRRPLYPIVRACLEPDQLANWASFATNAVAAAFPNPTSENSSACKRLLPHAKACAMLIDQFALSSPAATRLLNQLGYCLCQDGLYYDAERFYRRALAIDEASLGSNHPAIAVRLNNLAMLFKTTGRLAEAETLLQRAVEILESNSPYHPCLGSSLCNFAELLRSMDRLDCAEEFYRRALTADENSLGPNHPVVVIRLMCLASVLRDTRRPAQAEPYLSRALGLALQFEQYNLQPHPDREACLDDYSLLLREMGYSSRRLRTKLREFEAAFGVALRR